MFFNRKSNRTWRLIAIFVGVIVLFLYFKPQNRLGDPPHASRTYQYFKDEGFHSKVHGLDIVSHCDARYAPKEALSEADIRLTLQALLNSYEDAMSALGVETWIAHGTLLGWYWNQKLLPWETGIDVHVSGSDIEVLAAKHNMTEHEHELPDSASTRKYLLDINPFHAIVSQRDVTNKVDGRWIDTTNGKYISITAVHIDKAKNGNAVAASLFCKDGHRYKSDDVYPLARTLLEEVEVSVPKARNRILNKEFGMRALTDVRSHRYVGLTASEKCSTVNLQAGIGLIATKRPGYRFEPNLLNVAHSARILDGQFMNSGKKHSSGKSKRVTSPTV